MAQFAGTVFKTIRAIFSGGDSPEGEAWIDADELLTPREVRLRRVALIYQAGAGINVLLAAILLLMLALAGGNFESISGVILGSYDGNAGVAIMLGILGVFINVSMLLQLAVGTQAQEFWMLALAVVVGLANIAALIFLGFWPALAALIPLVAAIVIAGQDIRAYHSNPVMLKELRGRMRGVRAFAIITIFLLLMGSFTVMLYLLQLPNVTGGRTIITGELGRLLFIGVVGIEMLLIIFIVPALTAGAVTGERERKTYDLLQTTLLSAPSFAVGKLESALGYIFLLLLSAIPLQSIAFLFGGVSETEVLLAFVLLMVTAFVLGAMGIYFSAQTERTLTATVRVYTVAMVLIFGLPIVSFLIFRQAFGLAISGIAVGGPSPLAEAALIYIDMLLSSLNPITSAFYTQQILIDHQQLALVNVQLQTTGTMIPVISPWILTAIIYMGTTAALILLSVRRMRRYR